MIDPHIIRIVQGDRVSSPDILWVQVLHGLVKPCTYTSGNTTYRNMDVLYNHILIASRDSQTLTLKDSLATNTDNALIRANIERGLRRIIVRAVNPRAVIARILD